MKLFFIKHKLLIIIIAPILFFLLLTFTLKIPNQTIEPKLTQQPTPVKTPEQKINEDLKLEISVDEDRHEFNNPQDAPGFQKLEILSDDSTQYTYSSSNPNRPNIVITNSENFVIFKRTALSNNQPLTIESFTNLYGPARWTFMGSVFYGSKIITYIYPDYGVALKVNPENGLVLEQHAFTKTSIEEYIKKFGDDIPAKPEP